MQVKFNLCKMRTHTIDEVVNDNYFISLRDGPLESLWEGGGAKYKKNIRAREN